MTAVAFRAPLKRLPLHRLPLHRLSAGLPAMTTRVRAVVAAARERARPVTALFSPVGSGTAAVTVLAWLLGWRLGWIELMLVATACLLVLLLSVPFVLGGALLQTTLDVDPVRVFVGTPAAGRLIVTNPSRRRLLPVQVDLPIGAAVARFAVPSLGGSATHDELFVVPTNRRAVLTIGPATSVQGDPLGLLKREMTTSGTMELFVHPTIVALPTLGSGLLRDLEGQTTRDLSASDLAFHTLRDYVPGDDRRYIHWRSSAKADRLLVRQFLDTRRSRVTVVVDADTAAYATDDEFELAMSVAGSLGVRCIRDDLDVTVVGAGQAVTPSSTSMLLDSLSRGETGGGDRSLSATAARAATLASDTSLAVLITGSGIPFHALRTASTCFGPDVTPLVVRAEIGAPSGVSVSNGMVVLAIRALADLPRLLTAAAR